MSSQDKIRHEGSVMSQYTVVAVDDEPNILQALKRCFSREPFQIRCAASGAEGLRLVAETADVAVIISDQRMPMMNGSEFLTRSREYAPDAIRVLLTGYSDMDCTVAAINEGGATHYIVKQKPWDDAELLQTVQSCVLHYHQIILNNQQQEIINKQNAELRLLMRQLTKQNTELERLASTDHLTGLTNRRMFLEALEKEQSRVERYGGTLAMIMFDIDHFKRVNDTWGHVTGDTVLCEIARMVSLVLRKLDIPARYGGDEFVILLPGSDLNGGLLIAERLRQMVAETAIVQLQGPPIKVTISIGLVMLAPDESAQALLIRADQAMYLAKNDGRNRVIISTMEASNE